MPQMRKSKHPAPDTYDHLWSLLPVFVAFFAAIVFAGAADDRPLPKGAAIDPQPASTPTAAQRPQRAPDPSAPSTDKALAGQPDGVADHVASF